MGPIFDTFTKSPLIHQIAISYPEKKTTKLTPDYLGWALLLAVDIGVALLMLWILNEGLIYEKQYKYDTNGYTMVFFAALLLLWDLHEIRILFHFLRIELGRKLEFDESNRFLMVTTNETTERFRISDLREVIFCGPRISSRTSTAHLSYTQLNFKSGKSFIVTSFVLNTQKMEQLLGGGLFKRTHFDRKLFEGITRR